MQLTETKNKMTGAARYYIDNIRVGKARFNDVKRTHDLDTFKTVTAGKLIRHYCSARPRV